MKEKARQRASWVEVPVDAGEEHILLEYGDLSSNSPALLIGVARIRKISRYRFGVEFLLKPEGELNTMMLNAATKEIDFFLVELMEEDPWVYARYHCGTAANVYSRVHWSYLPQKQK